MKSSLKLAAIAAFCNYASAKEIEVDPEVDAALYKSGLVHEKIMSTKEVRSSVVPALAIKRERDNMLRRGIIDLLGQPERGRRL